MTRGEGFEALSFTHRQLDGLMDPLIMVDHFTMTEPTFGPHAHAGLSAVSVLFEDSTGSFRNKVSLGNDIELTSGDLYWLKAARGAVYDESPPPVRARMRSRSLSTCRQTGSWTRPVPAMSPPRICR